MIAAQLSNFLLNNCTYIMGSDLTKIYKSLVLIVDMV